MPTAEIGRWEFFVPDGWEIKDSGIGVSYIEAPDETMGFYQKTIKSEPAEPSAQSLAEYIQKVHRRGFEADPNSDWQVTEFSGCQRGDLYWSRLDMWDETANYRVLSVVSSSPEHAVQLTLHDYDCKNYEAPNSAFNQIEQSLRLAAGAA